MTIEITPVELSYPESLAVGQVDSVFPGFLMICCEMRE